MDNKPTSLSTIPAEILCLIIQNLDPIALVNLSQTSHFYRFFISPQPQHFVQRILALELIPQHGGITPLFRGRDNNLAPPANSPEWAHNKYACTGCMKLLRHQMFDNHSILGLGLRKPPPGSEEADKLSDWEPPGNEVARWKRIQRHAAEEKARMETWRRRYALAVRSNRQWVNGFMQEPENDADDDALAEAAEKVLCGRSRHKRLCVGCKKQRGMYSKRTRSNIGTTEAPMIKSREVSIYDELSRTFPREIHGIPEPPTPRLFKVQNPESRHHTVTTFTVFCRHCSTWQELASFRKASLVQGNSVWLGWHTYHAPNPQQRLEIISSLRCNHCLAKEGLDKLRNELLRHFVVKAEWTSQTIRSRLKFGWSHICTDFFESYGALSKARYVPTRRRILGPSDDKMDVQTAFDNSCDQAYGIEEGYGPQVFSLVQSSDKDRRELRRRMRRLRKFLDQEADPGHRLQVTDGWMGAWLEDYEDNEECLFYIFEVIQQVQANPQILVGYALSSDRFRYPRPRSSETERNEARSHDASPGGPKGKSTAQPINTRSWKRRRRWKLNPDLDGSADEDEDTADESDDDDSDDDPENLEDKFWRHRLKKVNNKLMRKT